MLLIVCLFWCCFFFFFKQKTAYEMRISDWSSDVCSSDLNGVWHGYLMSDSGIADTITDDREEDQVGDGLGFGERELSFPTAEEMIAWIDNGYPIEKAAKIAA